MTDWLLLVFADCIIKHFYFYFFLILFLWITFFYLLAFLWRCWFTFYDWSQFLWFLKSVKNEPMKWFVVKFSVVLHCVDFIDQLYFVSCCERESEKYFNPLVTIRNQVYLVTLPVLIKYMVTQGLNVHVKRMYAMHCTSAHVKYINAMFVFLQRGVL